ncbi:MAG: pseudaminic acid synthase [Candidatus Methylacidiphilales bacterium]
MGNVDHQSQVLIIAELSANHGGSLERAIQTVKAAADAGADAIKIQTYTADTLTIDAPQPWFQVQAGSLWEGRTLYDLYQEAHTPWEWHAELKAETERAGLLFFSTPFDATAVDFLEQLDVPMHKIASFELVDHALLAKVAATGKPVIMSTGMATLEEIEEAVDVLRKNGCRELTLLKCTSAYPAPYHEMHLRTIPDMAQRFQVPVGLSDHTLGSEVAIAAVALGAGIIEKHFTLSRSDGGPDAAFSMETHEFKQMVSAIRNVEKSLGHVCYEVSEKEAASRVFRRSLFVVEDIKSGEVFTGHNVRSIRPGHGLPPKHLVEILGQRAARDVERGTPMTWDLVIR